MLTYALRMHLRMLTYALRMHLSRSDVQLAGLLGVRVLVYRRERFVTVGYAGVEKLLCLPLSTPRLLCPCELIVPVRIRRHTSAYVSIRQHTSAYVRVRQHTSAYVSIRLQTSAVVSRCQHTSACERCAYSIRQHTAAYVSIRQHTSAYVIIREHT